MLPSSLGSLMKGNSLSMAILQETNLPKVVAILRNVYWKLLIHANKSW